MTREVHAIPPAPRRTVRWSSALWFRWPLALLAFLFAVYGGLWTLMLFFAAAGKPIDDRKLDAGAVLIRGEVVGLQPTQTRIGDVDAVHVDFRFEHDGIGQFGNSFAPTGPVFGQEIDVEYLPDEPHINRVRHGRISLLDDYVTPALWLTVIPGVTFALIWIVGALRLRDLLVHGDVAVANITDLRPIAYVQPGMLSVRFTFRDHRAQECAGHHWVRERSSLGQRLASHPSSIAVVHHRDRPLRYRLVVANEFTESLQPA